MNNSKSDAYPNSIPRKSFCLFSLFSCFNYFKVVVDLRVLDYQNQEWKKKISAQRMVFQWALFSYLNSIFLTFRRSKSKIRTFPVFIANIIIATSISLKEELVWHIRMNDSYSDLVQLLSLLFFCFCDLYLLRCAFVFAWMLCICFRCAFVLLRCFLYLLFLECFSFVSFCAFLFVFVCLC